MAKIILPEDITPELVEETGWHIGDGSMNFYENQGKLRGIYQLRGHIEDDVKHYVERVKPIFRFLYGINISLREMPSARVFGFQIWNDDLVLFKQKLGLPAGKKFELEIPKVFLEQEDLKKAVLRGIFDTDGCVYLQTKNNKLYPRIEISTISFNLSEDLLEVFKSLGFRTTRNSFIIKGEFNRKRSYTVAIRGVEMFHKFMNDVSPKNPKHIEKYRNFLNSQNL